MHFSPERLLPSWARTGFGLPVSKQPSLREPQARQLARREQPSSQASQPSSSRERPSWPEPPWSWWRALRPSLTNRDNPMRHTTRRRTSSYGRGGADADRGASHGGWGAAAADGDSRGGGGQGRGLCVPWAQVRDVRDRRGRQGRVSPSARRCTRRQSLLQG